LLDEMMDFGYPQYTEAKILSEFIKTDAYRMEVTQPKNQNESSIENTNREKRKKKPLVSVGITNPRTSSRD